MTWSEVLLVVLVALLVLVALGWRLAARVDRIHRKVVAARLALDAQLARRAMVVGELAGSGVLDPASCLALLEASMAATRADDDLDQTLPSLAEDLPAGTGEPGVAPSARVVVRAGLTAGFGPERLAAESSLSQAAREALSDGGEVADLYQDPQSAAVLDDLAAAWYRAVLARRFHNEAVVEAQALRRRPVVRLAHLAGHAPMPAAVVLDDGWPPALRTPVATGPTPTR